MECGDHPGPPRRHLAMSLAPVLLVALTVAAVVVTFAVMVRASRAYESRRRLREAGPPARRCSTCRSRMAFAGVEEFRTEGAGEVLRNLFGASATSSGALPLEVYACPACRAVDLVLPPAAGPELETR